MQIIGTEIKRNFFGEVGGRRHKINKSGKKKINEKVTINGDEFFTSLAPRRLC